MGRRRHGRGGVNYVPERGLFQVESPTVARLVADLLAARAATATAGNRRPLFAAMDILLAGDDRGDGPHALPREHGHASRSVRLARIRLTNWKAFERADLAFPEGDPERPVVVVGGANGFGKSSILEAFTLGLFGRRSISDAGFLMNAAGRGAQRRNYRSILERNLHRSAKARDEGICSVALEFETAEGLVSVERKWYYEDGRLIEDEEELLLRVGEDRSLLDAPAGVSSADWYEEEIDRRIMPSGLAPFFAFDGEQVERWAERRLSEQVRGAVARMLGIESLGGLVEDLLAFARDRGRDISEDLPIYADAAGRIEAIEAEIRSVSERLQVAGSRLAELRQRRDDRLLRVASLGGASHADLQQTLEAEHRLAEEHGARLRELVSIVAEHGPALLVGERLLGSTAEAIDGGPGHEAAHLTVEEIDAVWIRFAAADPPLDDAEAKRLRLRFERAFAAAPTNVEDDLHQHLDWQLRRLVATRLRSAASTGRSRIVAATAAAKAAGDQRAEAVEAVAGYERRSVELAAAQAQISELSAEIEGAEAGRGSLKAQLDALTAQADPLREEIGRRQSRITEAAPRVLAAEHAKALAASLDGHLAQIAQGEHQRLGDQVTRSFRKLSHKDQLERIEIGVDGSVALTDARGRDVTDYNLSAGESQLFALALISAVGAIVGERLPLIVDTPLGRLDARHRERVLDMFAERRAQTILLTQPEEINAQHLARLAPVLGASLHLVHAVDAVSGVGTSTVVAGYDPDGSHQGGGGCVSGGISA